MATACRSSRRLAECEAVRQRTNTQLAQVSRSLQPAVDLDAGAAALKAAAPGARALRYDAAQAALESLAQELSGLALMDGSVGASARAYAQTLTVAAKDCGRYATALRRKDRPQRKNRRAARRRGKKRAVDRIVDQARKHLRLAEAARARLEKACSLGGLP